MSTDINAERQQQRVKEFMHLLPLTLALAGLPAGETGRIITEGQMEARGTQLRNAFKIAKLTLAEIVRQEST